jgi:hypothetical protein
VPDAIAAGAVTVTTGGVVSVFWTTRTAAVASAWLPVKSDARAVRVNTEPTAAVAGTL